MKFYNRSNRPATIPMPECSKEIPVFGLKINKETGKKELKKTGTTNIYEKIQAAKESCEIYNILKQYQEGNIEVLDKVHGVYGDFTNMPKTLAESQQALIDAEKTFMSLPLDVRKEFNHSTSEFLAAITNGKFETIMRKFKGEKGESQVESPKPTAQPTVEDQILQQQKTLIDGGSQA